MAWIWFIACNNGPGPVVTPVPEPVPTFPVPTTQPTGTATLRFEGEPPKNVLMFSIDTTRRDRFASYSSDGTTYTPFLDELMQAGVRLDDHQQCSNWTYASTSCTLAGQYPEEAGFIPALIGVERGPLPDGQKSLAYRLGEQGYYSILIASNAWLTSEWNNAQGYDQADQQFTPSATLLTQEGLARLDAAVRNGLAENWLLHIHLVDPHPPYNVREGYTDAIDLLPPIPWDLDSQPAHYETLNQWPAMSEDERALLTQHLWARYTAELQYMDDQMRLVWATLESGGWLDDTLVAFWTDHGEQFWERGQQTHAWHLGAEENDAVLFFWAKNLHPGSWSGPTHAVDLVPTVLDAVGKPAEPDDEALNGFVLGTAPETRVRFGNTLARSGPAQSITKDGFKLQYYWGGSVTLHDRNTDRYETEDLYAPDHPQVDILWPLLVPRIVRMQELVPTRTVTWPEGLPHP